MIFSTASATDDFNKIIFFGFVFSLWAYWLWTRRHFYWFALNFPGPKGLPLIGSLYKMFRMKDIFPRISDIFTAYKSYTVCMWFGPYPFVMTADPEFIEKVLTSSELVNKSTTFYKSIATSLGDGLITSSAPKWHHNRKLINPTFSHKVLVSFIPIFNKGTRSVHLKLDKIIGCGGQKLATIFQRAALSISVETTMGKEMQEGVQVDDTLSLQYEFMIKEVMKEIMCSMVKMGLIIKYGFKYQKFKIALRTFVDGLIRQKLSEAPIKEDALNAKEQDTSIKKNPNIFIDQAIKIYQRNQFDWENLIDESNTIVIGSFETTSNGTFSTFVMLAMHPEIQEKLFEELVTAFPDKEFEVEYEHLEKLSYLDMVVNETLRLAPSVPLMGREVVSNTQLLKDIPILPKGMQIAISIYHLHRRKDIWGPNAHLFNPDNFLPENRAGKHPYAYIPFSKGIRNCIGWRYALLSMKVMIAKTIRKYKFTTKFKYDDLVFVESITLKYNKEPLLEVYKR